MTTIKLKNGSGAPTAGDLVQGEPALDLTNKRLYTENASGTVIEVGTNPTSITTGDITATGTASFANLATTGNITFGDNDKAIFGAGSDLQIYHNGSNSYIDDAGTGDLYIRANNLRLANADGSEQTINTNNGGNVELAHAGTVRLATTSTGIDVTGTVTADGLTVDGAATLTGNITQATGDLLYTGGGNWDIAHTVASQNIIFKTTPSGGSATPRIRVSHNGDVSLYEDTGTTAKFFWDASAESLGIGTSSPEETLSVMGDFQVALNTSVTGRGLKVSTSNTSITDDTVSINAQASTGILAFQTNSSERMRIDSGGNAIFTKTNGAYLQLKDASAVRGAINVETSDGLVFTTGASFTERMRIASDGHLLVGKTSSESTNTVGFEVKDNGIIAATADGSQPLILNRKTSDGTIAQFRKDNSTVGSIGTANSGDLYIGNDDTTLLFAGGSDAIIPRGTAGATRDAAIDLGLSAHRFKDLYLSGVANIGGTAKFASWSNSGASNGIEIRSNDSQILNSHTGTGLHVFQYFYNANGAVGSISASGSTTAYNTSSDYRLKENVVAMTGATERLKQLAPKRFNFIADADMTVDGFLAHEVQSVVPEAITGTHNEVDHDGNPVYQGIDQSKLVPLLVATIQELEARIAALESN